MPKVIKCPKCGKEKPWKYGKICTSTTQRYRCRNCNHVFSDYKDAHTKKLALRRANPKGVKWKQRIWRSPPELEALISKDVEPFQHKIERLLHQEYSNPTKDPKYRDIYKSKVNWKKRIWRSPPELDAAIAQDKSAETLQHKIERLLYQDYGIEPQQNLQLLN